MKKVLIVDDEPLLVKSMCLVLKYKGFDVQGVMDGFEGIRAAESFQPDFIILDVMMPGIDGWETLKRLQNNDKTSHIPVIIFTAKEYSNGTNLAHQAGAADMVTKPVEPEILISLLKRLSDE